jgi:hypothetical protein
LLNRALLLVLVLLGLASAQTPQRFKPWPELYKEWVNARKAHNDITNEEVAIEKRIRANELKVAPLRAEEDALQPNDPRRAEIHKRLHEAVNDLKIGEDKVALALVMKKETEARTTAIQSGTAALRGIDDYLARERPSSDMRRQEKIAEAQKIALELGRELDAFEQQENAFPSEKLDVPPRGSTPTRLASFIALYTADASNAEDVAAIFSAQADRKIAERDRLMKFQEGAATVEGLSERLKVVSERLESVKAGCKAWSERAKDDRKQILELQQQKAETEERLSRDKGGKGE